MLRTESVSGGEIPFRKGGRLHAGQGAEVETDLAGM